MEFEMFLLGGRGYIWHWNDDTSDQILVGAVGDPTDREAITDLIQRSWETHTWVGWHPRISVLAPHLVDTERIEEFAEFDEP